MVSGHLHGRQLNSTLCVIDTKLLYDGLSSTTVDSLLWALLNWIHYHGFSATGFATMDSLHPDSWLWIPCNSALTMASQQLYSVLRILDTCIAYYVDSRHLDSPLRMLTHYILCCGMSTNILSTMDVQRRIPSIWFLPR